MELDSDSLDGYWATNNNSGYEFFIINDAKFSKLCILGSDVEPCFEGASVTALDQEDEQSSPVMTVQTSFSKEPEFVRTLLEMRNQLTYALQNEGGSYMPNEIKDEVIEEPITTFDEAGDTGSADNGEAAEAVDSADDATADDATETSDEAASETEPTPTEEVASPLAAAAEDMDDMEEDNDDEDEVECPECGEDMPKKRVQGNYTAEEEDTETDTEFACGKKKYAEEDKKDMPEDEESCEEPPCDPEEEKKYAGCGKKKNYTAENDAEDSFACGDKKKYSDEEEDEDYACGDKKKKYSAEDEEFAACGDKKKKCYEEDEEDEDFAACGSKKKKCYSSEQTAEVVTDHSLEDVEAEFAAVKAELETAKADYAALKSEFDAVNAELQSLREFKLGIENKDKDAEIAKYFMLSDEDKADIIAHKSEYTLDEIKSKLAVLYVEKNVDFSSLGESETEEVEESEDPITTFSLESPVDVSLGTSTPEWVEALCAARK